MAPLLDGASHRSQFSILESAGTTPDDCYTDRRPLVRGALDL
jgi:hypothetical protein